MIEVIAVNEQTFGRARLSVSKIRIERITCLFGVALLVGAVKFAPCQANSARFSSLVPPDHGFLVSKNELLTPEKAQKVIDQATKQVLRGRFELAQKEISRALDICPHCASALTIQGVLLLQRRNYLDAAQSFQRAIGEDPSSGTAFLGLGVAYNAQGRFKEAVVPLDSAAPLLPSSWLLHFESAFAHLGLGDCAVSLTEISLAEGFSGSDQGKLAGAAFLHGLAYIQMKNFSAAKRYLDEAVRHDPDGTYSLLAKRRLEQIRAVGRVQ